MSPSVEQLNASNINNLPFIRKQFVDEMNNIIEKENRLSNYFPEKIKSQLNKYNITSEETASRIEALEYFIENKNLKP